MPNAVARLMVLHERPHYIPVLDSRGMPLLVEDRQVVEKKERLLFLDISTDAKFGSVALSILRGRFRNVDPKLRFPLEPPKEPPPCAISRADFEALKEGQPGYSAAKEIVDRSAAENQRYQNALREYEALVKCMEEGEDRLAPALLESRRHLPGEGFDIVYAYDEYF